MIDDDGDPDSGYNSDASNVSKGSSKRCVSHGCVCCPCKVHV
jgi:hypothetical protein